jgi:hypothetical protein
VDIISQQGDSPQEGLVAFRDDWTDEVTIVRVTCSPGNVFTVRLSFAFRGGEMEHLCWQMSQTVAEGANVFAFGSAI